MKAANCILKCASRIAFLGVLGIMMPGLANADCKFVAGYGAEAPYHYPDDKGRIIGIDADVLRIVMRDIGCELDFKSLPWKRTLLEIKHGQSDLTMGASFKEERAKFAHYSIPYRGQPHVVAVRKSAGVDATSLQEFLENGHTLGVVLGWHYTNKIRALLDAPRFKAQISTAQEFEQLLKMHVAQRFTGFLANPSLIAGIVGKDVLQRDYRMIRADIDILHFLLSKKTVSEAIARRFNDRLEERLAAGFFFDVCGKYESQLVSGCDFLSTR
ncbi:MAG: transporter substrate-binding domain-containing protein [Alphaproteobacteria bacterium]|nr:transporter substrate-binding domain-containing protein [Alphaproteobacteria bacterium]